jgi:predicted transcriptional regulator of viral defense system
MTMLTTTIDETTRAQWHALNASKGSRLMMTAAGYQALSRPDLPIRDQTVTDLLRVGLLERVGRGMYQITPLGKEFVYTHKDTFAAELGEQCDDCGAKTPTTAVYRHACRHHWLCANCRQNEDSSNRGQS